MDGLMGAFIVHPKEKRRFWSGKQNWPLEAEPADTFIVTDYITAEMHGSNAAVKASSSLYSNQGSAEINMNPQIRWFMPDGTEVTGNVVDEIFMNGRTANLTSRVPMQEFDFSQRNEAHFICGSSEYGVEMELDDHFIIAHEVDGYPVTPTRARRIFLQPGETARVSFERIQSNDSTSRSSFLLRASLAGKYRGWNNKVNRTETERQLETFALIHFGKTRSAVSQQDLNWCPLNNIMNNPYRKQDNKYVPVTADHSMFENCDYYPSEDDKVLKLHFNTNFALGPSINGKNYIPPAEPYSTNGQPEIVPCTEEDGFCTHIVDIPLGSIVEMTLTGYSKDPLYSFYHPMHIHGHEMYVLAEGHGEVDEYSNNMFPNGSHPAFTCSKGKLKSRIIDPYVTFRFRKLFSH